MKTLQDFYEDVMNSDDLKKDFVKAARGGKVDDFLKEHGCDATAEEAEEFLAEKSEDRPLGEDELALASGGVTASGMTEAPPTKNIYCWCD